LVEPEPPDEPVEPPVAEDLAEEVVAVPLRRSALRTNASYGIQVAVTFPALITPTPPIPHVVWS